MQEVSQITKATSVGGCELDAHAFMMTMMLVMLPLRVPCSSTWGPSSHLLLAEFASWVLKKSSCTCEPCCHAVHTLTGQGPWSHLLRVPCSSQCHIS